MVRRQEGVCRAAQGGTRVDHLLLFVTHTPFPHTAFPTPLHHAEVVPLPVAARDVCECGSYHVRIASWDTSDGNAVTVFDQALGAWRAIRPSAALATCCGGTRGSGIVWDTLLQDERAISMHANYGFQMHRGFESEWLPMLAKAACPPICVSTTCARHPPFFRRTWRCTSPRRAPYTRVWLADSKPLPP